MARTLYRRKNNLYGHAVSPGWNIATWLHQRGNAGLLSPPDVAQIILQAASALQYAHDRQIIHQDVKPSNFLIRSDEQNPQPPLFAVIRLWRRETHSVTSNISQSVRGTPTYMAPEQWKAMPYQQRINMPLPSWPTNFCRSPTFPGRPRTNDVSAHA